MLEAQRLSLNLEAACDAAIFGNTAGPGDAHGGCGRGAAGKCCSVFVHRRTAGPGWTGTAENALAKISD